MSLLFAQSEIAGHRGIARTDPVVETDVRFAPEPVIAATSGFDRGAEFNVSLRA